MSFGLLYTQAECKKMFCADDVFGMSIYDEMLNGQVLCGNDLEECSVWQQDACLVYPPNIRNQCEAKNKSYNPTVGVDSVSAGITVTATFPLAPGLATKNSAINVLKGTGYDPTSFGQVS